MDGFIGEIRPFSFNYVPYGWLACNGAAYPINAYQTLYAVLGGKYGYNQQNQTFNVPNLQGLSLVGTATGSPAGNDPNLGHITGTETITLNYSQMGVHNHDLQGFLRTSGAQTANMVSTAGPTEYVSAAYSNASAKGLACYSNTMSPDQITLADQTIGFSGTQGAHSNMMPYMPITYAICVQGDWPPRP